MMHIRLVVYVSDELFCFLLFFEMILLCTTLLAMLMCEYGANFAISQQKRGSADAASSKAAEVAAQAAASSTRNPSRLDELSTLD